MDCESSFSKNYQLSIAFKSTVRHICQRVKKISDDLNNPPKKRKLAQTKTATPDTQIATTSEVTQMLSEQDRTLLTAKLTTKLRSMMGIDITTPIQLKLSRINPNRHTILMQCPIESCHEKISLYKEIIGSGFKHSVSGFVRHLNRKHLNGPPELFEEDSQDISTGATEFEANLSMERSLEEQFEGDVNVI